MQELISPLAIVIITIQLGKSFGNWRCLRRLRLSVGGLEDWRITRNLLRIRGIISSKPILKCVLCLTVGESLGHFVLLCNVVRLIWRDKGEWIDFVDQQCGCFKDSLLRWRFHFCKSQKIKSGKEGVIWLAICRNIWLLRNKIIFKKHGWKVLEIIWNIKITNWK